MYRSELESVCCATGGQKAFTTPLLKQYKNAYDRFCALHAGTVEFVHANEVSAKIKRAPQHTHQRDPHGDSYFAADTDTVRKARRFTLKDYENFLLRYVNELQSLQPHNAQANGSAVQKSILPYAAWHARYHGKRPDLNKITEEICHIQTKYLYNTALS